MGGFQRRVLRVRASEVELDLSEPRVRMLLPDRLPSAMLRDGARVVVEVSLGALADEVVLTGLLVGANARGNDARTFLLDPEQGEVLNYLVDVQTGEREAAARGHRRLPSRLPVRWAATQIRSIENDDDDVRRSRLRDISRGGAFIVSDATPSVGEQIEVTLDGPDGAGLSLASVVSWVRHDSPCKGFGVSFRPPDPATAQRLNEVVRGHEDRVSIGA